MTTNLQSLLVELLLKATAHVKTLLVIHRQIQDHVQLDHATVTLKLKKLV